MARADDLDAVVEDEQPDRRADEVVAMRKGVDQQFFEDRRRYLRCTRRIDAVPGLHLAQIAHHESAMQETRTC